MSLASHALGRLRHLHRLVLQQERFRLAAGQSPGYLLREARLEKLEERLMLSGDRPTDELLYPLGPPEPVLMAGPQGELAYSGGSGDVFVIDLDARLGWGDYQIQSALVRGGGWALTLASLGSGGDTLLKHGPDVLGRLIEPTRLGLSGLGSDGILAFAASTSSTLADDADPATPGFQGQIELTVATSDASQIETVVLTVGAGATDAHAITVGETTALLRTQQRLNLLGFTDRAGNPLALSGTLDAATQDALRRFQSAIDPDGALAPADASGQLDAMTVA